MAPVTAFDHETSKRQLALPHFHEKAIICQAVIGRAPWRSSDGALVQFVVGSSWQWVVNAAGPMNRAIHTSIRTLRGLRLEAGAL